MNKYIYILFSTDEHHSKNSYNLIGAFDEKQKAIKASNEFDGYNLTETDLDNLNKINQTQGLEINYVIQKIEINQIN
jgi:hypothetical protein